MAKNRWVWGGAVALWLTGAVCLTAAGLAQATSADNARTVRIAVFNVWELGANKIDIVDSEGHGAHPQLLAAAEVIRLVRPDVLLLNEIDYDPERDMARLFIERYLQPERADGSPPIDYAHVFTGPVNTGVQSGYDLNNDGQFDGPDDGWGFGRYPGQYGMALLSQWPLDVGAARTFRALRWIAMPGHLMPDGRAGRPEWYDAEEAALLRLSSKSFWDVAVELPGLRLHVLASHPTPPVFDGDEDRNGRRNYDEIRLVADYLHAGRRADWIVDDRGLRGGLDPAASAVVLGDLNADPVRETAPPYGQAAIMQLLEHPRLKDPVQRSEGDLGEHPRRGPYPGDSRTRTSGFGRIDYALPTRDLDVVDSGVFLPPEGDPARALVTGDDRASDHLLVWLDIKLPAPPN